MTSRSQSLWRLTANPLLCVVALLLGASPSSRAQDSSVEPSFRDGAYWVRSGQNIQRALDLAAANSTCKVVRVESGRYFPGRKGQAFIWLNHRHDGISLEAVGKVILSAQNPGIADRQAESYPAVVNHVVYFGDGITSKTRLRGFEITGGNNFATDAPEPAGMEPRFQELRKTEGHYGSLFFYTDGAAIKIFGRSYPVLEDLEIRDNAASPCAGGISIEHRGFKEDSVQIRNCRFIGNKAQVTGPAVDLLPGSSAVISNCLFVGNISNTGNDYRPIRGNMLWPEIPALVKSAAGYLPIHGSGALTVFPRSFVSVDRCTFTANSNGIDDRGEHSIIRNSIFWNNVAPGNQRPGARYELDIARGRGVENCFIQGKVPDVLGTIDPHRNRLGCADPEFDDAYQPRNSGFSNVGYRPQSAIQATAPIARPPPAN